MTTHPESTEKECRRIPRCTATDAWVAVFLEERVLGVAAAPWIGDRGGSVGENAGSVEVPDFTPPVESGQRRSPEPVVGTGSEKLFRKGEKAYAVTDERGVLREAGGCGKGGMADDLACVGKVFGHSVEEGRTMGAQRLQVRIFEAESFGGCRTTVVGVQGQQVQPVQQRGTQRHLTALRLAPLIQHIAANNRSSWVGQNCSDVQSGGECCRIDGVLVAHRLQSLLQRASPDRRIGVEECTQSCRDLLGTSPCVAQAPPIRLGEQHFGRERSGGGGLALVITSYGHRRRLCATRREANHSPHRHRTTAHASLTHAPGMPVPRPPLRQPGHHTRRSAASGEVWPGRPCGTRTHNQWIKSPLLCQLS